jgi:hypothetical protein
MSSPQLMHGISTVVLNRVQVGVGRGVNNIMSSYSQKQDERNPDKNYSSESIMPIFGIN